MTPAIRGWLPAMALRGLPGQLRALCAVAGGGETAPPFLEGVEDEQAAAGGGARPAPSATSAEPAEPPPAEAPQAIKSLRSFTPMIKSALSGRWRYITGKANPSPARLKKQQAVDLPIRL